MAMTRSSIYFPKQREKMAGANLRDGSIEVAFEP